ncbi:N-methyl-L-tryptophan oxidase [Desertimonas flava]|uniref:N-methyl-L-tryptophan oxidase n=1 Tax=Desertimonas flava TaxID=2064846 RepID=UPI000E34B3F7|nr:N-methyl-L-tryptophan oxidase [Desertimonas flava]
MTAEGHADVIVVGLGAMGSATADALAGRGVSVIGLEAFGPGHANGSSHGTHRIVRQVIEEGPFYVPLALDAFERWAQLEEDTATELLVRCGAIRLGPPGCELLAAFRASADAWSLPYESLSGPDVSARFPGFAVPDDYCGYFEPGAGFVHAARAVATLQDRARRRGADLRFGQPVSTWTAGPDGVGVSTATETFAADRLVITAGAWTGRVSRLDVPLVANRVVNAYFEPHDRELFSPDRLPPFIVDGGDLDGGGGTSGEGTPALRSGTMYGIPVVPGDGLKVGVSGTPTDPDHVDRVVTADEVAALRSWVDRFLPAASGPVASTLTCLYTKTPDEHFVIDRHPDHDNVVVASPCSGHGFKYTPAIGALLGDLATGAEPRHDLRPFALDRFA